MSGIINQVGSKSGIISGGGAASTGTVTQSGTTQLDYEEGTWTPLIGSFTLNSGSLAFTATYTKIGNLVIIDAKQTSGNITWTNNTYLSGLPFSPTNGSVASFTNTSAGIGGEILLWSGSQLYFYQAGTSQHALIFCGSYQLNN